MKNFYEVEINTYAGGNLSRQEKVLMDWDDLVEASNKQFDGFNGTVVVSHCRILRCTYCGQWESIEVSNCGCCGQPL